jgi:hypothetical protein
LILQLFLSNFKFEAFIEGGAMDMYQNLPLCPFLTLTETDCKKHWSWASPPSTLPSLYPFQTSGSHCRAGGDSEKGDEKNGRVQGWQTLQIPAKKPL